MRVVFPFGIELVRGGRRVRVGKWVNLEIQNLKKESRITANGNIPFMLYKAAEEKN